VKLETKVCLSGRLKWLQRI